MKSDIGFFELLNIQIHVEQECVQKSPTSRNQAWVGMGREASEAEAVHPLWAVRVIGLAVGQCEEASSKDGRGLENGRVTWQNLQMDVV